MTRERLVLAGRLILAAVFFYAGVVKASAGGQFLLALLPFTFVPASWLAPLAAVLPLVEIAAGALLLWPRTARLGAAVALTLLIIFCAALGWALSQGIIVACGCFGRDETPSAAAMAWTLARNAGLAALAVLVLTSRPRT